MFELWKRIIDFFGQRPLTRTYDFTGRLHGYEIVMVKSLYDERIFITGSGPDITPGSTLILRWNGIALGSKQRYVVENIRYRANSWRAYAKVMKRS